MAVGAELAAHRAVDRLRPPSRDGLDSLTVMVKTFERPAACRRLLDSIERLFPGLGVIVVDDSRSPVRHRGVETVVLPFDSGVSAGRNAGLARVQTPFFVLADDDLVFFHRTRLARAVATLRAHPEIDVIGGRRLDLPTYRVVSSRGRRAPGAAGHPAPTGTIGGLERREMIANFYVARTERVREVAWDDALERVDHSDFFGRARGILTVVEDPELAVLHAQTPFDRAYAAHRNDIERDLALLALRWSPKVRKAGGRSAEGSAEPPGR